MISPSYISISRVISNSSILLVTIPFSNSTPEMNASDMSLSKISPRKKHTHLTHDQRAAIKALHDAGHIKAIISRQRGITYGQVGITFNCDLVYLRHQGRQPIFTWPTSQINCILYVSFKSNKTNVYQIICEWAIFIVKHKPIFVLQIWQSLATHVALLAQIRPYIQKIKYTRIRSYFSGAIKLGLRVAYLIGLGSPGNRMKSLDCWYNFYIKFDS